jgi:hypothetical protein
MGLPVQHLILNYILRGFGGVLSESCREAVHSFGAIIAFVRFCLIDLVGDPSVPNCLQQWQD